MAETFNTAKVESVYERELISNFNKDLSAHLSKNKWICATDGNVKSEILKFAKKYDQENLTEFYDIIKRGK